jgi:hypothetical protein
MRALAMLAAVRLAEGWTAGNVLGALFLLGLAVVLGVWALLVTLRR